MTKVFNVLCNILTFCWFFFYLKCFYFCFLYFQMDFWSHNDKISQWLADSDTESIPGNQSSASEEADHLETELHNKTDGSDEDAENSKFEADYRGDLKN